MKKFGISLMAMSIAGIAQGAEESGFDNQIFDREIVSPAQLTQMNQNQVGVAANYGNSSMNGDYELAGKKFKSENDTTNSDFGIAGLFSLGMFRLGAIASLEDSDSTRRYTNSAGITKEDLDSSTRSISPFAALHFGPIALGATVNMNQDKIDDEYGKREAKYDVPTYGALFHKHNFETGAYYSQRVDKDGELDKDGEDDKMAVSEAAVFGVHGRVMPTMSSALGAHYSETFNNDLSGSDDDITKDIRFSAEMKANSVLKVTGRAHRMFDQDITMDGIGGAIKADLTDSLSIGGSLDLYAVDFETDFVKGDGNFQQITAQMTTKF